MVALFSTLLSNSNEGDSSSISSSLIPTVIQLYTSTLLNPSSSTKSLPGHAILSYQAIQVPEDAFLSSESTTEEASTLFGTRQGTKSTTMAETPNLGVWNCRVSPLMDSLLNIPSGSSPYIVTVDLSDPTSVEPDITSMQQALVRHLIATSDRTTTTTQPTNTTTSLQDLQNVTFGLAPDDTPPTTTTSVVALQESQISINLIICAILPSHTKEYDETQAQNLVVYHLHRFAAAMGATLVFCETTTNTTTTTLEEEEQENAQKTLNIRQVAHVWRQFFAQDEPLSQQQHDAIYAYNDSNQEKELIETVFLRNANHPPAWNSSTDSLWKALPAKQDDEAEEENVKKGTKSGDEEWLQQLRNSIASLATETSTTEGTSTSASNKPKQTEDAEVSDFFANLLK